MTTRRRQLVIPGLPTPAKPEPRLRARKDLSEAAFRRAIERNGFRRIGTLRFVDLQATRWRYMEAVTLGDPIRIARRKTLAKLLKSRRNQ